MNQKTVFNRAKHTLTNPYLKISSKLIRDPNLDATAIGIMNIILNNSNDYIINKKDIQSRSNLNSNQFKVHWKMLLQYKYIVALPMGNHVWKYIINEEGEKQEATCNPLQEATCNPYKYN